MLLFRQLARLVGAALVLAAWYPAAWAEDLPGRTGTPPVASDAELDEDGAGLGKGVVFGASYLGEAAANLMGGIERDVTLLDMAVLTLSIDGASFGVVGLELFVSGLGTQGTGPSELVGDAQGVSNIEAPNTWKVYEAWVDYSILSDQASLRVGLHDLNSEFDVIETGGMFLHASHGIGADFSQSGGNGPSIFPTTSLGARLRIRPVSDLYLQAIVLDGVPGDPEDANGTHVQLESDDGVLLASELGYEFNPGGETPDGKVAVGGWYYTGEFSDLAMKDGTGNPLMHQGSYGGYVLAEHKLYSEGGGQGLAVFGRYGAADSQTNPFAHYIGAGAVYTGLIPGRDKDLAGLAVATVINGKSFRQATGSESAEVATELSYRLQPTPWLAAQQDLQYIVNPGLAPGLENALLIMTRIELSFESRL